MEDEKKINFWKISAKLPWFLALILLYPSEEGYVFMRNLIVTEKIRKIIYFLLLQHLRL